MKYYKRMEIEDPFLFDNISVLKLAKLMGVSYSYLFRVKSGEYVVSEEQYQKLITAKKKLLDKN